jgi:nitroreductase
MLDTIFARRSIRKYTGEPVTEEQVRKLLEAAMAAPSANNSQPWHFVVVQDREQLRRLAEAHPYGRMQAEAALSIAVCADPTLSPRYWVQDCSAATENLLLAATALGLGGVWLGVYPNQDRVARVKEVLGIPEGIEVLCLVAIGHPAEKKPPRTQYNPQRVHRDRW